MNEEKKAIEELEEFIENDEIQNISVFTAKKIKNIIDSQQKEIEELKTITQNYNAIGGETFGDDRIIVCSMKYFDDGYFKKNYIFKDKIIDILNYLNDTELNNYEIVMAFKKMMKELLEDGDHIPRID